MADFRPFQAWRYNPQKIEFGEVIAPPYDIISAEEQDRLYERSPYNCVRLILNRAEEPETAESNRYLRAQNFFSSWKNKKILIQEPAPCFYLYRETFPDLRDGSVKSRFALIGRMRLEPFEKGVIIPHERTLSRPRADRRKLLETTQTNFSPVFGLYEEAGKEMDLLFSKIIKAPFIFEAADDQKVRHTVWTVEDPGAVKQIQNSLKDRKIYIADGHHRYQTALEYGRQIRRQNPVAEETELSSDFVLMALAGFHDEGLVLLPTHRMILPYPGFDKRQGLSALKEYFQIKAVGCEALKSWSKETASFNQWTQTPPSLGLILENQECYLLTLTDREAAQKIMPSGKLPAWYRLEVAILSHLILEQLWNLPENQWETTLRYTHNEAEAAEAVGKGAAKAAFLLQALPVEILREVGKAQELMPQKSTYFYPKLASGLVFYSHLRNGEVPHGHTLS